MKSVVVESDGSESRIVSLFGIVWVALAEVKSDCNVRRVGSEDDGD